MAIPPYHAFMLPLLRIAGDGQAHRVDDCLEELAKQFGLSTEELRELLPSGKQTVIYSRVGWAKTYLVKARLLESPSRGKFKITDRGREVLRAKPDDVDAHFLEQFPEFLNLSGFSARQPQGILRPLSI